MSESSARSSELRLRRLIGFLDHDPTNLQLLADTAAAALDEGDCEQAAKLIDRYAQAAALPPSLLNLRGLVAIERGDFGSAASQFEALLADRPDDVALRFNLAWCKGMEKDYAGASALLDETAAGASAQAALLKTHVLHHLGELEDALAWGLGLAKRYADDQPLMGALAAVAIDAEALGLAEYYAARSGGDHDGLAARGVLRLGEDRFEDALALFDQALDAYPGNARADLGKGMVLLVKGDAESASAHIDRAAALFDHHLGSWVAAGWAHYIRGDYATSRARFERALAIDDTFSEIHGGLAVLDVVEDHLQSARQRTEIALRLDRKCFSAALAKSLLLSRAGDASSAKRVVDIALNVPIGQGGRTISQAVIAMGLVARKPSSKKRPS
jgi:tetratricopeptide (TPR) repeat protein